MKPSSEENKQKAEEGLARLKQVARDGGNLFEVMMDIVEYCSVGQVTQALLRRQVESSVGICDNMAIEILPELLEEFFKHFKDLPRPLQFLLNFMFYAIPLES